MDVINQAQTMLSTYASVGATAFDVTLNTIEGKKLPGAVWRGRPLFECGFEENRAFEALYQRIDNILVEAARRQLNVIIRPRSKTTVFIQLDDLKAEKIAEIDPFTFLAFETSPGNFQGWLAMRDAPVEEEATKDFLTRLRKGTGADPTASGSTRIAGSLNFKPKYAPNFPRVRITKVNAGCMTTTSALENAGLMMRAEEPKLPPRKKSYKSSSWPSYEKCLAGAPLTEKGDRPDISRADYLWCRIAYQWGRSREEIAQELSERSVCARMDGPGYVKRTVNRAADRVDQENGRSQRGIGHG
jgi:RepB DNA-primase from phage plasmid